MLHKLRPPVGANKKRKRVGRGRSSGHGKTAGRGGKGQTARTGKGKPRPGFEGGQVPMYRRMPKRGFVNTFARAALEINVDRLAQSFEGGETVDLDRLRWMGWASRKIEVVRILGRGDIGHALKVRAHYFTPEAKRKIEAAGGEATQVT